VKTRNYIVMLVLSFLIVISAYAAVEEGAKEPQAAGQAAIPKAETLKTEVEKVSYIIGTQIAGNFKAGEIEVNLDSLMLGLKDALEGKQLALSQEEMKLVYGRFQQQMRAKQAAKQAAEAAKNLAAGTAFLEANKAKEGVKVLPSGLQYKVIKEGTGNTPTADDKVKTHYRGTLIDGTEFDSSYKRNQPAEFPVKGVIKGWTEALQLMKVGGKWELYIPANLAYGQRGRPSIPANSTLIFEIELLEIVKADPAANKARASQPSIQVK
jgi:FKBP-type peptidyl-prolyl cis-trans isomerase FklB